VPCTAPDGLALGGWDDVPALTEVVAAAFWDLAPSRWLIADPAQRRAVFPPYSQVLVELALTDGIVLTTPDRSAAALWLDARAGQGGTFAEYDSRLAAAAGPHAERFATFDRLLEERYPIETGYFHLAILAVHPARQRQGLGRVLLDGAHQRLDAAGLPSHLEASDLGTRSIYLRHGYADHGDPVTLPGGPSMYPMWREPASGPS